MSKAVSEALKEAEKNSEGLEQELHSLEFQARNAFKAPPQEWIRYRVERLCSTLSQNTATSAMALREIMGSIRMEPVLDKASDPYHVIHQDKIPFKPYYVAYSKSQTLALLDERFKGSNWWQWRRRQDSNLRCP